MPRPGSHKYDIKRARVRKRLEDEGAAPDAAADERANRELQRDAGQQPQRASDRAAGPKAER